MLLYSINEIFYIDLLILVMIFFFLFEIIVENIFFIIKWFVNSV